MRSLLLFSFLTFYFVGRSQIIDFPDANFKNALVNSKCVYRNGDYVDADLNDDGEIDMNEALEVGFLDVSNKQIFSLEGIDNFINMEIFNCSNNQLTTLNMKGSINMTSLFCNDNQLTSLDLQEFTNLTYIDCKNNQLTSLNVQGLQELRTIFCNDNQLSSLDLQGLVKMTYLDCYNNQIISLDLKDLNNLSDFSCYNNLLTSLDVKGMTNLGVFKCFNNQLDTLDLQGLTNIFILECHNNKLNALDIQNLTKISTLNCSENQLSNLNTEGLIELRQFNCSKNKLTSLNVDGLINLTNLNCSENELTSLNLQGLVQLISLNCDYNQLTSIEAQDLVNLRFLHCRDNQLDSINIKGLTNLRDLLCFNNKLTNLDLQGLTNLRSLYCLGNQLTELNLEGLTNLETLIATNNQIKSLNLQGLSNLINLGCDENQLSSLDVQGLTNLYWLNCKYNQLTSINTKGLNLLDALYCSGNLLDSLDVKELVNLGSLACDFNHLTALDVAGLKNLSILHCSENQLTSLLLKGTMLSDKIRFENNPNLQYICCNEDLIPTIQDSIISYGLTNCEVNSYCTFTPGDKFYVIKGENKYDDDNNGCDNLDFVFPSIKYLITDSITTATFISNSTGSYSIPIQAGTYTITPIIDNPENFEVSPTFLTTTFPNSSDTINQDFCITPKGFLNKINITIIPLFPPARPGFDASYSIVWENVGNQIESGTLNFTYEETLLDYILATQTEDLKSDGIVSWYFNNLLPFEKREITVTLKVNRPTDTPAVNAGDNLYLTASILDNIFTLENTVVGSYDPNDKTCLQGDRVKPDMVGEFVDYLIRFENTGNYAAENVVVKDIIDTKTFDVSTLKITDASHEVYTRIEGNKVEFIFENIQLPFDDANNDGYIAFKIKTLPTLVLGDSLKNLADIYFDYNFPIRTNEAQTTVALPVFTKDITTEVKIYPNPVTDILYLDANDHWSKAEIFDIAGRIMRSVSLDSSTMDVSELESGTYFIRLKDIDSVGLVKFVKI